MIFELMPRDCASTLLVGVERQRVPPAVPPAIDLMPPDEEPPRSSSSCRQRKTARDGSSFGYKCCAHVLVTCMLLWACDGADAQSLNLTTNAAAPKPWRLADAITLFYNTLNYATVRTSCCEKAWHFGRKILSCAAATHSCDCRQGSHQPAGGFVDTTP